MFIDVAGDGEIFAHPSSVLYFARHADKGTNIYFKDSKNIEWTPREVDIVVAHYNKVSTIADEYQGVEPDYLEEWEDHDEVLINDPGLAMDEIINVLGEEAHDKLVNGQLLSNEEWDILFTPPNFSDGDVGQTDTEDTDE